MLVLSRKIGERIIINDNITVEVLQIIGNRIRLGVTAPTGVPILREELLSPRRKSPRRRTRSSRPPAPGDRRDGYPTIPDHTPSTPRTFISDGFIHE